MLLGQDCERVNGSVCFWRLWRHDDLRTILGRYIVYDFCFQRRFLKDIIEESFLYFFFALSKFWFSKGWMQFGGSEPTNLDAIVLRMMELLWLWSEAVIFSILKNLLLAKQLCKVANVQEEFCVPLKNFLGVLFGWVLGIDGGKSAPKMTKTSPENWILYTHFFSWWKVR